MLNLFIYFFLQIGTTKGDTSNIIVSDLKSDVSYDFRITAKNSAGTGPPYLSEEPIIAGKLISEYMPKIKIVLFQ